MQSVEWTDDTIPTIFTLDSGDCIFFDRPDFNAFAVGDQIVHMTAIGPSVYRVIDVCPEYDCTRDYYTDVVEDYTRVTIRGV